MKRPISPPHDREYQDECRDMLREELEQLRDTAIQNGWDEDHVAEAMVEIAGEMFRNRVMQIIPKN
ncbi:hypothetical protein [Limoniibacter endophyticus]|uniref:Uncharacterized protein n=1 Tax=Limoniibacter endophyticus TaxID=1565040 RepID=A0A8J3DSA5_9HYPH|nr:hypothetical protein [Limoniibacter endophyticus]GHC79240.1 hypothetical protein GCM10010136_31640 [Limoniibacter endophyticus]